jgi:crotonobetainyl-CoA:carnitine CoA-transferase CaiB-like acyl-CoA transferase
VPILPIEMDGRRFRTRLDLPKVGEHTRDVLSGLDYSKEAIADLEQRGVVKAL